MHHAAVWQHSSNLNKKIVHNSIEHFLCDPYDFFSDDALSCLWIVFANSVFQVPPLENSQAGWDLGNRMAKGCWFDVKWVCPMGTYAWGIQVFCSRWWFEVRWCLISWTAPFFGMPPHFIDILVSRSNTGQWLLLGTGKSKTKN